MRILSISGGGYQSLYGVSVLAGFEKMYGPLHENFDIFFGTSAGAILASAASVKTPMAELLDGYLAAGDKIFPKGSKWNSGFVKQLRSAKYTNDGLREVLETFCFDKKLEETDVFLGVTTARLKDSEPVVFSTHSHPKTKIIDVVLASCAAPVVFPAVDIDGDLYSDGGIYANSPDLVALDYALSHKTSLNKISMFSLGSMNMKPNLKRPSSENMGMINWMRYNRIFQIMVGTQAKMNQKIMKSLIKNRYLRVDADKDFPLMSKIGLDKTDNDAKVALLTAAELSKFELEKWGKIRKE